VLEPFGAGNSVPLFALLELRLEGVHDHRRRQASAPFAAQGTSR
jgi:hypothetical protein